MPRPKRNQADLLALVRSPKWKVAAARLQRLAGESVNIDPATADYNTAMRAIENALGILDASLETLALAAAAGDHDAARDLRRLQERIANLELVALAESVELGLQPRKRLIAPAIAAAGKVAKEALARSSRGTEAGEARRNANAERDKIVRREAERLRRSGKNPRNVPSLIEASIQRKALKLPDGRPIARIGRKTVKKILDS